MPLSIVNKFGNTTNADSGIATDIWDGANATNDVDIWVAPTQARTHQVVSTSTSDDGDPAGVGARTVRLYGLTSWSTPETSEDVTLNGTTNVATANSYVIIHRMQVLTKGATSANVGVISATADTDSTLTAQINAGEGQTQMAIYGVPSGQTLYLSNYYATAVKTASAATCEIRLLVNSEPDAELTNFVTKHILGLDTTGNSVLAHSFGHPFGVAGPAIVKLQCNTSANNLTVSGGFDGQLLTP